MSNTPNHRRSSEDLEQSAARHKSATITGTAIVLVAVGLALMIFFFAYLPTSAPNSGSTSTSGEVDPAASVQTKDTPAPGINRDGR